MFKTSKNIATKLKPFLTSSSSSLSSSRNAFKFKEPNFTLEYLEKNQKGISIGTLCRLDKKNAISKKLVEEFSEGLKMLKGDKELSVFILRSTVPGVFCAGADLKERLEMPENEIGAFVSTLRQLTVQLSELPFPSIAALDGAALGGGLEFALGCDLRVAAEPVKLGLVETKLAIIPGAGGTQRLPRLIGASAAKDLIFTAKIIDGLEAHKLGMVNYVVPQNKTRDAAYLKTLEIAEQINLNGPLALRLAKQAIDRGIEGDLKNGLFYEKSYYAQVIPTKDRIEGLKSFQEKRPPKYTGI